MKRIPARVSKRKGHESPRDATLRILKLKGESSVAELCKALNLTHTAVRRYLSALEGAGLVEHRQHQHGIGRPVNNYKLTETSVSEFPDGYAKLAVSLLDTVFQHGGHPAVMEFLKNNNDHVIKTMRPKFANKSLKERVEMLAKYFNDNGYMSGWLTLSDGNLFLYNQHCAVFALASQYRQFCVLEPRLIEELVEFKTTRQQYILKGQSTCGYVIDRTRPFKPGSAG